MRIVTTLRRDPFKNIISKESPLGRALMGKAVGERIKVQTDSGYDYYIVIRNIEKGEDDSSLDIRKF